MISYRLNCCFSLHYEYSQLISTDTSWIFNAVSIYGQLNNSFSLTVIEIIDFFFVSWVFVCNWTTIRKRKHCLFTLELRLLFPINVQYPIITHGIEKKNVANTNLTKQKFPIRRFFCVFHIWDPYGICSAKHFIVILKILCWCWSSSYIKLYWLYIKKVAQLILSIVIQSKNVFKEYIILCILFGICAWVKLTCEYLIHNYNLFYWYRGAISQSIA